MEKQEEIRAALRSLGYKGGTVKIVPLDNKRAVVLYNGERIGIWDFDKKTFVD